MFVIDAGLRFSQCPGMFTHDEIRDELLRRLDAKTLTGVKVAKYLGIEPPRITEIKDGRRRIQPAEMAPLAALLEMGRQTQPEATPVHIMAPVQMPSARALTDMMHSLLVHAGQLDIADELAPRLARRLPGALAEALVREPLVSLPSGETLADASPPPRAKVRPEPELPPHT